MSRLRSSRGAKAAPAGRGGAAAAGRRPGVLVPSAKSDIFVAMLGIALAAILIACLLMLLILWKYDFKVNGKFASVDRPASATALASLSAPSPTRSGLS